MFNLEAAFGTLRPVSRRIEIEREIDYELQFHIELLAEENIEAGLAPEAARRAALIRFGDLERLSEVCRETRITGAGAWRHDITWAFRMLGTRPWLTVLAALTLSLGCGALITVFSMVNGVLWRPLPYKTPHTLVVVQQTNSRGDEVDISNPQFSDLRDQNQSFAQVAAYNGGAKTVTGGSEPDRSYVTYVSRDFFSVLGVDPFGGRVFLPDDHLLTANPVAVVSYRFWQDRLGSDKNLVDKRLTIAGRSYAVTGIMPPGFSFPAAADLWIPRELENDTSARSAHNLRVIARLKSGVSLSFAQTELSTISQQLEKKYPEANAGLSVTPIPLPDYLTAVARQSLLALLITVSLVLLVACVNVTNLLLIRDSRRRRETASRIRLGASRFRMSRQLLIECVLLSLLGASVGLGLASIVANPLLALVSDSFSGISEVSVNGQVLAFALGVSLLTAVFCWLVPAFRLSHFARPDIPIDEEQIGNEYSSRLRSLLVITEFALTMILLVGAGMVARSFWNLLRVDPGFDPENVLTAQVSLPSSDYQGTHQTVAFYRQALERIRRIPGVQSAGLINNLPLGGRDIDGTFYVEETPARESYGGFRLVSPDYFRSLTIPLVKGRSFTEQDDEVSAPVAIIAKGLGERYWPNRDPIGQRVRFIGMDPHGDVWMTVIGVAGDVKHTGLDSPSSPEVYLPYAQRPFRARDMTIVVRTVDEPANAIPSVRGEMQSLDKNLPVKFNTMNQLFSRSLGPRRSRALLLASLAFAALLLSVIGFYIVMTYSVTRRIQNINVISRGRKRELINYSIKKGMSLAAIGVTLGSVAVFALSRAVPGLFFGVKVTDPTIFVLTSLTILAAALAASYVTARGVAQRATMISNTKENSIATI